MIGELAQVAGSGSINLHSKPCNTQTDGSFRASLYSFQTAPHTENENAVNDLQIANSSVMTYLGIDKREGLVTIGKRLLRSAYFGKC